MKAYLWNLLIAFDQLANAALGPLMNRAFRVDVFGFPDETISSGLGKVQAQCKPCLWICKLLHRLDPNHCAQSVERDEGKN